MEEKVTFKPLISKKEIQTYVSDLGKKIEETYKDSKNLIIIGILKGSFIFLADLVREINLDMKIGFISASSYDGTTSTGKVKIAGIPDDLEGADILIVEDILDTGNTLSHLIANLKKENPHSLKSCALISKPSRREIKVTLDFEPITIPNKFIVGYGLDYDQKYRNLPEICELIFED